MTPHVYKFYDKEDRLVAFRGYVRKIVVSHICEHELLKGHDDCTDWKPVPYVEKIACKQVRTNRIKSLDDAKALLRKLKKVQ